MATQTTFMTLKLELYRVKPTVIVCSPTIYWEEIRPWIEAAHRKGRYADSRVCLSMGQYEYTFYFDDPDVALEFKMRWSGQHL